MDPFSTHCRDQLKLCRNKWIQLQLRELLYYLPAPIGVLCLIVFGVYSRKYRYLVWILTPALLRVYLNLISFRVLWIQAQMEALEEIEGLYRQALLYHSSNDFKQAECARDQADSMV